MARRPVARTIVVVIAALAAAAPAGATFAGRNGLVAYGAKDGVHVMRPDGTRDRIVSRVAPATDAEWGPRGNRIAFSSRGSIYVADLQRGTTRRLTFGRFDRHPSWSPQAALIIYTRYRGPGHGLWRLRVADGRKTQFLGNWIGDAELSPDGRWIAYFDPQLSHRWVFLLNPWTNSQRTLAVFPRGDGQPRPASVAWSPDSREVAINTEANAAACEGCQTLYTVNVDGSDLKAVAEGGISSPFYSPDGQSLAYCSFGYSPPNYEPFAQQQALVHHGEHYVGPTCGTSWQARP